MASKAALIAGAKAAAAPAAGAAPAAAAAAAPPPMTDAKAADLMKRAEAKLTEWGFFTSSQTFKEEAAELFEKAASQFKLSKDWENAARAHVKAAETCEKYLKAETDACNHYLSAAKAYKNAGSKEANKMFKMVVALHMENNRFNTAAKIYKEIAEIEEKENNIPAAVAAWEQAADCYFAEDQQSNGNQCLLKVAHYAALREDYKKAIDIYEKVATAYVSNNLMVFSAKEYMFKSLLCHFVLRSKTNDVSGVAETNEKYKGLNPQWEGTRECKLIEQLVGDYEAADEQKFKDHLFNFDRVSRLDNWTSTLLLTVKRALVAGATSVAASSITFTPRATGTAGATAGAAPDMQGGGGAGAAAASVGTSKPANEPDMM